MGAVDTTYTFTATDTITSAKMNNIIDQTTITTDAIIGTTLEVASGKLKIRSQGITSNEIGANSVVTAAITDSNVTTAKIADSNVTQAKLAANVVGNGPVFRAYPSSAQSIANATDVKVLLQTEEYDTNSNFASSRFTPTVAGYYLIKGSVGYAADRLAIVAYIFKNGSNYSTSVRINENSFYTSVVDIIYFNGTTDYVELYTRHVAGITAVTDPNANVTNFSGCLIRSA